MDNLTIAVDVDDVCLDLVHGSWLPRYNWDYNDNLHSSDITDWYMDKFVKPECGKKLYDYLKDPRIFLKAPVVTDALWGVRQLRNNGHRVIFVTASDVENAKFRWLVNHKFLFDDDIDDYVVAHDKSLILADVLIDDNPKNVTMFTGRGILFLRPWNERYTHLEKVMRWVDLFVMFRRI